MLIARKVKYFFILYFALTLVLQSPCFAFWWWNKGKQPIIKPIEKIQYVNINWWGNFSDSYLKNYIITAVKNNHDARKASWQVEEYRQNVKYQFSQELPSLSVGGNYIGIHYPQDIRGINNNIFAIPFLASYEADIFLKNRDKTKSSKKAYESTKFQEKSIYISLASDVATTYINLIKFDKQIKLQEELVQVKKEELKREQSKFDRGVTSVPKLNDAKKSYNSEKSELDELIKTRDQTLNQLAVLIGESPENTAELKRGSWENFEYTSSIPKEISSDVVFSRPDIMSAEAELKKAQIDIRVARKEFLPRLNIVGLYSFTNLGGTFGNWDTTLAAIFAGLTQDLFTGGRKIANLKINKAKYEQMFEAYRQADLNALKEVNDSLLVIKEDTKIDKNTTKNLFIQEDNYKRAQNQYKNGVISYPELLEEQEKLITSQQNKINSKTNCWINYITLYKSVGGQL